MALPGVTTVIKDRFYTLLRTDIPRGPRLVAIAPRGVSTPDGTADGPSGTHVFDFDPYFAVNEQKVIAAYGNGSGAHRVYLECAAGGAPQVFIVSIPYNADLSDTGLNNPFDAAFAGAESASPDIIVCWGRGGHPLDWDSAATPSSPPFGFYADSSIAATPILSTDSMALRVANAVMTITSRNNPCFAVMGLKPFKDPSPSSMTTKQMTAAQVASHIQFPELFDHNNSANDVGMYLSIVAAEMTPLGYPKDGSFGYSNGAGLYAGYVSGLNSWINTTGRFAYQVSDLRYNPTRPQLEAMTGLGVVPVALDFNHRPLWVDGVTWASSVSDYSRLSTLRIVFDAVNQVRGIAQGFVGQGATLQNRNALETAITSGLRGMHTAGALLASDFIVSYFPTENKAVIDLVLTPAFELRNIEISVAVQI